MHAGYLRGEWSIKEGAEAIGYSQATARRRMRELGLELRPRRQPPSAGSPAQAEQQLISERLARRIDALRQSHELSIVSLAHVSGLSLTTVQSLQANLQDPRLTTVLKLCRGLEVAPGDLLDDLPFPVERRRRPLRSAAASEAPRSVHGR